TLTPSIKKNTGFDAFIDLTFGHHYDTGVEFIMKFYITMPESIFKMHHYKLFEFSKEFYQMKNSLTGYIAGMHNWDILMMEANDMRKDEKNRSVIQFFLPLPEYKLFDLSCVFNRTFGEDSSVSKTMGEITTFVSQRFNKTREMSANLIFDGMELSHVTNRSIILRAFNNSITPEMAISPRVNDMAIVTTQRVNISSLVDRSEVDKAVAKSCCAASSSGENSTSVSDHMWTILKSSFYGIINIQCHDKLNFVESSQKSQPSPQKRASGAAAAPNVATGAAGIIHQKQQAF